MAREAHKKVEPALTLQSRRAENLVRGPEVVSYESVADLLRRTREQYGEDLRSVAEALRIRYVHLLAIEEGRFRDLPGSTYALGFVRSYAEFLGLDGPEMVERFKEEVAELNRKTQLVFPTPVPEGKVPGGALILISVILLGAAYGAWSYLSRPGSTIADLIPPVPEHLQSLSGETAGPAEGSGPSGTVNAQDGALADAAPGPASDEPTATEAAPGPVFETPTSEAPSSEAPGSEAPAPEAPAAATASEAAQPEAIAGAVPAAQALSANGASTAAEESAQASGSQSGQGLGDAADSALDQPAQPNEGAAGTDSQEDSAAQAATAMATEPDAGSTAGPGPATMRRADAASDVNAVALPETSDPAMGTATDAEAAQQALVPAAPADHLDSVTEEGIPAAPQLESRVPGREPQVYGADNLDARIVLRAQQDSWVQVRDAEDSLLLTRVLRQGDEYRVPNRSGLTLLTGNAGGIEILVDGRRLAPLGPLGAVRRDIVLDPEQLARGGPVSE